MAGVLIKKAKCGDRHVRENTGRRQRSEMLPRVKDGQTPSANHQKPGEARGRSSPHCSQEETNPQHLDLGHPDIRAVRRSISVVQAIPFVAQQP